ncbi:MAG: hypothetical protein JSV09_01130, partial [Thermoplasmata archaeon]
DRATIEEKIKHNIDEIKTVYENSYKFGPFRSDHIGLIMEKNGVRQYKGIPKKYVHDMEGFNRELRKIVPKYETRDFSWKDMKQEVKAFNKQR